MNFFNILLVLITVSDTFSMEVTVCDPDLRLTQFSIPEADACTDGKVTQLTKTCRGRLYNPTKMSVKIPVVACALVTTKWTGTEYFFGARTEKYSDAVYSPIDVARCQNAVNTKYDEELGRLNADGDGNYVTKNVVEPTFHWPTRTVVSAQNLVIIETSITYNSIDKTLYTPLEELVHCAIAHGSCQTGKYSYIWNWEENQVCPNTLINGSKYQEKDHDVVLNYHYEDRSTELGLSHINIQDLGLTYFSQQQCPQITTTCFGDKEIICLLNGDFLILEECSSKGAIAFFKEKIHMKNFSAGNGGFTYDMPFMSTYYPADRHLYSLNFEHALMADYARQQHDAMSRLECKLSAVLTSLLRIVSKSHPSEVLSYLTQKEVGAVSVGDTLQLLSCTNVSATVVPSMIYNGTFLSRPLVSFFVKNMTKYAQLYPDNIAYTRVGFIEQFNYLQNAMFNIGGQYVHFQNYSLTRISNKHVVPIQPLLDIKSVVLPDIDYEQLFHNRPREEVVSNDFGNILSIIQKNDLFNERLKQFFTNSEIVVPTSQGVTIDQLVSNNLSSVLSNIKNPWLIFLYILFNIMNNIWSVILTIGCLRWLYYHYTEDKNEDNNKPVHV